MLEYGELRFAFNEGDFAQRVEQAAVKLDFVRQGLDEESWRTFWSSPSTARSPSPAPPSASTSTRTGRSLSGRPIAASCIGFAASSSAAPGSTSGSRRASSTSSSTSDPVLRVCPAGPRLGADRALRRSLPGGTWPTAARRSQFRAARARNRRGPAPPGRTRPARQPRSPDARPRASRSRAKPPGPSSNRLLGDGQVGRQLKAVTEVVAQLLASLHSPLGSVPHHRRDREADVYGVAATIASRSCASRPPANGPHARGGCRLPRRRRKRRRRRRAGRGLEDSLCLARAGANPASGPAGRWDGMSSLAAAPRARARHSPASRPTRRGTAFCSRARPPRPPACAARRGARISARPWSSRRQVIQPVRSAWAGSTPSLAMTTGQASASCLMRRRTSQARVRSPRRPDELSRRCAAVRGEEPQPGPAQQHVGDAAGLLVASGNHRLGKQIGVAGDDRLRQLRGLQARSRTAARRVAVAEGELGTDRPPALRASRSGPRRHPDGISSVLHSASRLALDEAIDDLSRHPPEGGQLAAGDRQHPDEVSYSSALREMSTDSSGRR